MRQSSETEDDVGADLGVDVLHVELAEALAVHGPRAEVAHHHSLFRGKMGLGNVLVSA